MGCPFCVHSKHPTNVSSPIESLVYPGKVNPGAAESYPEDVEGNNFRTAGNINKIDMYAFWNTGQTLVMHKPSQLVPRIVKCDRCFYSLPRAFCTLKVQYTFRQQTLKILKHTTSSYLR